jgi:hypothetical protein
MVERKRRAVDVAGQRVNLIERQGWSFLKTANGWTKRLDAATFFGPGGDKLIPEGDGFYRTRLGVRYKVVD